MSQNGQNGTFSTVKVSLKGLKIIQLTIGHHSRRKKTEEKLKKKTEHHTKKTEKKLKVKKGVYHCLLVPK